MVRGLDGEYGLPAALYSGAAVLADEGTDPDGTDAVTPWGYSGAIGVTECVEEESGSPIWMTPS